MAYSESLACRVREMLERTPYIVEKKMFGGLGTLYQGNMLVGVRHDTLILRLGVEQAAVALKQPNVKVFDITGKPMKGWVTIREKHLDEDAELQQWLQQALAFVGTLAAK
jgi:TfoX/Sxy family transcriptional regulator of competence genes